jgi:hypothetical protein
MAKPWYLASLGHGTENIVSSLMLRVRIDLLQKANHASPRPCGIQHRVVKFVVVQISPLTLAYMICGQTLYYYRILVRHRHSERNKQMFVY